MDPEGIQGIARTFGVSWPLFLAQVASFSIVCGVLYAVAYTPILRMLEARRQQIAAGLANAEKIRDQLARIEIERRDVLVRAEADGKHLIEEARVAAARVAAAELRKAEAEAERILTRAREDADRDGVRVLTDLKRDVGRLVAQATAVVAGRLLTAEDHRRLAEETVQSLASWDGTRASNGSREPAAVRAAR
jgi:F-type H+-transporting ATPase subunit b